MCVNPRGVWRRLKETGTEARRGGGKAGRPGRGGRARRGGGQAGRPGRGSRSRRRRRPGCATAATGRTYRSPAAGKGNFQGADGAATTASSTSLSDWKCHTHKKLFHHIQRDELCPFLDLYSYIWKLLI